MKRFFVMVLALGLLAACGLAPGSDEPKEELPATPAAIGVSPTPTPFPYQGPYILQSFRHDAENDRYLSEPFAVSSDNFRIKYAWNCRNLFTLLEDINDRATEGNDLLEQVWLTSPQYVFNIHVLDAVTGEYLLVNAEQRVGNIFGIWVNRSTEDPPLIVESRIEEASLGISDTVQIPTGSSGLYMLEVSVLINQAVRSDDEAGWSHIMTNAGLDAKYFAPNQCEQHDIYIDEPISEALILKPTAPPLSSMTPSPTPTPNLLPTATPTQAPTPTLSSSPATPASEELMTFTETIDSLLDMYGQPYLFSTNGIAYGYELAVPVRLESVGNFYGIVSVVDNNGKAYQVERFNEYGSFWLTEPVSAGVNSLTLTYQYKQPH